MSSRIARKPIEIPAGVTISLADAENVVTVTGPKGTLAQPVSKAVTLTVEAEQAFVREVAGANNAKALSGTTAALIRNHIHGVSKGFEKKLALVGVGYRASAKNVGGKFVLDLTLGFSHPVAYKAPEGIEIATPSPTEVVVSGVDKQAVGQVASEIRAYRPPEPYKGKGVRYVGEKIILKETKK